MKATLVFSGMVLFFTVYLNVANEFVIPPKKRVSLSRLKEQCCQSFSQVLKEIPDALRSFVKKPGDNALLSLVADIQDCSLKAIEGYIEGSKKGFIAGATREQLEKGIVKIDRMAALVGASLRDHVEEVQGLLSSLVT